MSDLNETAGDRAVVAHFAAYCVGSCFGDWHPQCQLAHDRVLADDGAYEFYRNQHQRHEQWRAQPEGKLFLEMTIAPEDEETTSSKTTDDRPEVADWARDCFMDCLGRDDPRCELTYDRVMTGGEAYEFYRPQYLQSLRDRADGLVAISFTMRGEDEEPNWNALQRLNDADELILRVRHALALELGNGGTGCPDWLSNIYRTLDDALLAIRETEVVIAPD